MFWWEDGSLTFSLRRKKQEHTGSLDIDAALDFRNISSETYSTILELLRERGYDYEETDQPYIFNRTVKTESGAPVTVKINLLADEYGGTSKSHRTQKVQDVKARKARGCDLAFNQNISFALSKRMPDGAINEVSIKIADIVPFLVMKGMALWDRYKEKDAYDIYFSILYYPGGIEKLVNVFQPFTDRHGVRS